MTADTITPRRVRWLWAPGEEGHGRIPLGELTLIVGKGGVGKSTLLCTYAAWLTRGIMHGQFYGKPQDVLYVANEDAWDYTVVPRLMAAGADLSRVHFVSVKAGENEDKLLLPRDCERIEETLTRTHAVAIMLDPFVSNLSVQNTNNQGEVRNAVEAVRRMCERSGAAAIGLAHTRKAASTNLMEALMGSSELGNVCRSAMGVIIDPDATEETCDTVVILSQEKSNLGRSNLPSYTYVIELWTQDIGTETITAGRLRFLGKTDTTATDILSDQNGGITQVGECAKWLRDYLTAMGEVSRNDVMVAAQKEGYSRATLGRARSRIGAVTRRLPTVPPSTIWSLSARGR